MKSKYVKKVLLIIIFIISIIFIIPALFLFVIVNFTPEGYGKDTVVYLNNKCQIGHFVDSNDLHCDKIGTLIEDVFKYKLVKDENTIYVVGKKDDDNIYGILNYETLKFISYKDINYCNNKDRKIFMNIEEFKNL